MKKLRALFAAFGLTLAVAACGNPATPGKDYPGCNESSKGTACDGHTDGNGGGGDGDGGDGGGSGD